MTSGSFDDVAPCLPFPIPDISSAKLSIISRRFLITGCRYIVETSS